MTIGVSAPRAARLARFGQDNSAVASVCTLPAMPESVIPVPAALVAVIDRLEEAGHATYLVGRGLRELCAGDAPADFELSTEADPETTLEIFPRAVVIAPEARRVTLPTEAGPVDIIPLPPASSIEDALRHRDFRLHAVAYRPRGATWVDPFDGRGDRAENRLRTPLPAAECFAEDPVRALRAARLVAELGATVDPAVEAAMREIAPVFEKLGGRRVRSELDALLVAPHVEPALALLERTGMTAILAPGASADGSLVVPRLPKDLTLRWTAWLRGARLRTTLRKLRCPRDRAARIERLLQIHPVDSGTRAAREARARRLARRPEAERSALLMLRETELAASPDATARTRFDHLVACLERAQRAEEKSRQRSALAFDGRAVMDHLGCRPGATVGRALRFLAERVEADPSLNDPEALRGLLDDWAAENAV